MPGATGRTDYRIVRENNGGGSPSGYSVTVAKPEVSQWTMAGFRTEEEAQEWVACEQAAEAKRSRLAGIDLE